jgi:excisionase family DNA binding protein
MPHTLKSAPDGTIPIQQFYSSGQVAMLLGTCRRTAVKLIDEGAIRGIRMPNERRRRRVSLGALLAFVRQNPGFGYVLDRLQGGDLRGALALHAEPLPSRQPPPESPEHPRSVYRGRLPLAQFYTVPEAAFLFGLSRRRVVALLHGKSLIGCKVPATKPGLITAWKWKIPHRNLINFVTANPRFEYALGRIQDGAPAAAVNRQPRAKARPAPGPDSRPAPGTSVS